MAEVLVLVDHHDGAVRKVTAELLTAAARLGAPSAVVVGKPGTAESLAAELGAFGATKVYAAESDDAANFLITPQVAGLSAAAAAANPAAVLLPATVDGREIAGRLAVRLNSGLLADAVDVESVDGDVVATQSVFGGEYTVRYKVTTGVPIISIRPNAIEAAPTVASAQVVPVEMTIDPAISATVIADHPEPVGDRAELSAAAVVCLLYTSPSP